MLKSERMQLRRCNQLANPYTGSAQPELGHTSANEVVKQAAAAQQFVGTLVPSPWPQRPTINPTGHINPDDGFVLHSPVETFMALKPFTIVFSHYTCRLFAWSGLPSEVKKYLGNRDAIGTVNACSEDQALQIWRDRTS